MKPINLALLSLFTVCLFTWACRSEDILLPKETNTGLNTFGCKIDGKVWLPRQSVGLVLNPPSVFAAYNSNFLTVSGLKGVNEESIRFASGPIVGTGTYTMLANNSLNSKIDATIFEGSAVDDEYFLFQNGTSQLTITKLNTVAKIVSGTFRMDLKGRKSGKVIKITEGIFDIQYETL